MFKDKVIYKKPIVSSIVFGLVSGHMISLSFSYVICMNFAVVKSLYEFKDLYFNNALFFTIISLASSLILGWLSLLVIQRLRSQNRESVSESLHEIMMNSMSDSLVVFDESKKITIENNSFRRHLNPWLKEDIEEIVSSDLCQLISENTKVEDRIVILFDHELQKNIHYSVKAEPFTFMKGETEVKRWVVSLRNVEAKYQEEELVKKQMATVESNSRLSSLGEMATGFAHEINNPLSVISANNLILKKLLLKVEMDDKTQEKFEKLTTSVDQTIQRISKIIASLRNLAKNSHDEVISISLEDLIDELRVLAKVKLYQLGIDFYIENECEQNVNIQCSKSAISQVFMNLITNSIDALGDKKEKWIKIKFIDKIDFVDIIISDSGDGIPSSISDKIFQPMFTTKEFGQGMGLGLSIAHSIVEKQGGELYLDKNSENTTFVIKLNKRSLLENTYKESA